MQWMYVVPLKHTFTAHTIWSEGHQLSSLCFLCCQLSSRLVFSVEESQTHSDTAIEDKSTSRTICTLHRSCNSLPGSHHFKPASVSPCKQCSTMYTHTPRHPTTQSSTRFTTYYPLSDQMASAQFLVLSHQIWPNQVVMQFLQWLQHCYSQQFNMDSDDIQYTRLNRFHDMSNGRVQCIIRT